MGLLELYNAAPGDQIQHVQWPGVTRYESFRYVCNHGISPDTWTLTTAPEFDDDQIPGRFGDLFVTDGYRSVFLRDAIAFNIRGSRSSSEGTTYTIMGYDRRWRWQGEYGGFGGIDGWYNKVDARGKLVPDSIRSPDELARICLAEMKEYNFVVVLPQGLTRAMGANIDRYLRLGENFPATMTNPEFRWVRKPPAQALAEVAARFGCRVIYQPPSNRVLIVPLGYGDDSLPNYPYDMITPSIKAPVAPKAVGVYGPPARFQSRFLLEPVGEEWDGSHLHIDLLSYAPRADDGKNQTTTITWNKTTVSPCYGLLCTVTWAGGSVNISSTDNSFTIAQRWADMIAKFNGSAAATAVMTIGSAGNVLTITGKKNDLTFSVSAIPVYTGAPPEPADLSTSYTVAETQAAGAGGRSWRSCPPPHFRAVLPTDRLSYMEAIQLAQRSVWKCYRIRHADPDTKRFPLVLPIVGQVTRLLQLVVQPTKVEQVVPQPRIAGGQDKGNVMPFGEPGGILPEFYNGRSRDRQATVKGSVYNRLGRVFWYQLDENNGNTKPSDRVFTDFTVSNTETGDQLVTFGDYVYLWNPAGVNAGYLDIPTLILETAVLYTDADTGMPYKYFKTLPIPGGVGDIEWHEHDDLQLGVVTLYEDGQVTNPGSQNQPPSKNPDRAIGWKFADGDFEHCEGAADSYLENHAKKYRIDVGESRQYIGTIPLSPSGTIHQVTWIMGGGATTLASIGSEIDPFVPSFFSRRRAELLAPDAAAKAANQKEREQVDRWFGPPPSKTV